MIIAMERERWKGIVEFLCLAAIMIALAVIALAVIVLSLCYLAGADAGLAYLGYEWAAS
jgi:hypothetical protein